MKIIFKIGGSVITDKKSKTPKIMAKTIRRIAGEISEAYTSEMDLVLVHGAGSYGHPIVERTGIHDGIKTEKNLTDFAETQWLQNELNCFVSGALIREKIPAFPCQPSSHVIMDRGKIQKFYSPIKEFLDLGLVPVLYGVPAYDKKQGCSILSGDEIVSFLAKQLKPDLILHGTDVDGVFDKDPKKHPDARLIHELNKNHIKNLTGSAYTDVTGGMLRKVREIMDLNIKTRIFNATKEGNVRKALSGEDVGTLIDL